MYSEDSENSQLVIFVVLLSLDTLFNSKGEFKTVSLVLNLNGFPYP